MSDPRPTPDLPSEETLVSPPGSAGSGMPPSTPGGGVVGPEQPGDSIGPYRLISILGEGGFGTVWLAERREPFVQQVALKVVKAGMDSAAVVARFEQERQALAVMDHPGIAKVIDGGLTPTGRPYFAMEYVRGKPINSFCDGQRLTIGDRLRLFLQVCEAVQHAHMKGIIHRDLKPSNILVALGTGDTPQAKVIDFGIAKALTQRLTERTIFTETGQMIGTPEYMSPEQAEPDATDVDTRSDVYSLGVILYELLAGALPFDPRDLRSRAYREIQRIIREVDPPAPSTRLSTLATNDRDLAISIATQRQQRFDQLEASLKGELGWIPMKAMRKERQERYTSPKDLADDIRNYLDGRPLLAGPVTAAYRVRKFVRRNRTAVATAAAFVVLLATAAVVSTAFGIAESRARARAEQRERDMARVLDFQSHMLAQVGQEEAGVAMFREIGRQYATRLSLSGMPPAERESALRAFRDVLAGINPTDVAYQLISRVILQQAVRDADADYASEPFVRAGLLSSIGRTAMELGDFAAARDAFVRSRDGYASALGADDPRTLAARGAVAWAELERSAKDASADEMRAVVADCRRALGPQDPVTLESLRRLARYEARAGRTAEAIAVLEEVAQASAAKGMSARAQAFDLSRLGLAYFDAGRPADAEATLVRALGLVERDPAPPQRLLAEVLTELGRVQARTGDSAARAKGIERLRRALAIDEAVNGERHPLSFESRNNLAVELVAAQPSDAAAATEARSLLERSRTIGASLDFAPNAYHEGLLSLAVWDIDHPAPDADGRRKQMQDAVRIGEEALQTLAARSGPNDDHVLQVQGAVASLHQASGDGAGAERLLRDAIARRLRSITAGDRNVLALKLDLAQALASQGRWKDATDELAAAQKDAERERGVDSESRWWVSNRLLHYLERWAAAEPASDAAARLSTQRSTVDALCAARKAKGLPCSDRTAADRIPSAQ